MTGTVAKVSKGRVLNLNDYGNCDNTTSFDTANFKSHPGIKAFLKLRKIKPSICAACRHRISRHRIPEDLNEILIKRQSCTCRHLWQFLSAEFVKGGSVMRYVRSRASLLILGVFYLITRFFYPNFDLLLKTPASITKVFNRLIIYHLRVTSNSSRLKCIIEN